MQVWVLFNTYNDTVEGVYTPDGKEKKEAELYEVAITRRAEYCNRLTEEIVELKALRQPYITEAEMMLDEEQSAKEANHTGRLKAAKKQRKVLLRQAEHLTYDIKSREEKIMATQRMLKSEIIGQFGDNRYHWSEYYVEGE